MNRYAVPFLALALFLPAILAPHAHAVDLHRITGYLPEVFSTKRVQPHPIDRFVGKSDRGGISARTARSGSRLRLVSASAPVTLKPATVKPARTHPRSQVPAQTRGPVDAPGRSSGHGISARQRQTGGTVDLSTSIRVASQWYGRRYQGSGRSYQQRGPRAPQSGHYRRPRGNYSYPRYGQGYSYGGSYAPSGYGGWRRNSYGYGYSPYSCTGST